MKKTILTKNNWVSATLVALFVSVLAVAAAAGQASQSPEFSWSAELVSLDEPGRTVTVKARVWETRRRQAWDGSRPARRSCWAGPGTTGTPMR
jgi:hypothetical protein